MYKKKHKIYFYAFKTSTKKNINNILYNTIIKSVVSCTCLNQALYKARLIIKAIFIFVLQNFQKKDMWSPCLDFRYRKILRRSLWS